jgi:predicted ester cyclase
MSTIKNVRALETALAAFNDGFGDPARGEPYFDLYFGGALLHGYPLGIDIVTAARDFYRQLWIALPDGSLVGEEILAEGDQVAARYRLRGTHTGGELLGIPPQGAQLDVGGMTMLRFGPAGRVVERWQALDQLGLLVQLGAIPAAGGP